LLIHANPFICILLVGAQPPLMITGSVSNFIFNHGRVPGLGNDRREQQSGMLAFTPVGRNRS
jgi:hypothetical protein